MFKLLIVTAPQQKMPPGANQTWRLTDLVNFGRFWEQSKVQRTSQLLGIRQLLRRGSSTNSMMIHGCVEIAVCTRSDRYCCVI